MTDNLSPQYWVTVRVCMSVRRGAFYGHLQTETDIYGLSWGAAPLIGGGLGRNEIKRVFVLRQQLT